MPRGVGEPKHFNESFEFSGFRLAVNIGARLRKRLEFENLVLLEISNN